MSELGTVLSALADHTNKPATAHDLRAEPGDTFGHPAFVGLVRFVHGLGSRANLDATLTAVAPMIRAADPFRGATIALTCGSLVEMGGDPGAVFPHLLAELPRHLALALRAQERSELDPGALFDADPEAAKAATGLKYLLLATMAVICRRAEFRQALRANSQIGADVEALRDAYPEAYFVARVLELTDDLELIVLAPNEQKGWRVRLEAVASCAHLFTLLQATLIDGGHLAGESSDPEVIAAATGEAMPTRLLTDHARLHFSPWYSLAPDGSFDAAGLDGLIALGVEAHPAGIPRFDDVPVLLVSPPAFALREWDGNFFANIHEALRSRAEIVEVLPHEQAAAWLDRIRQARR
jgi:hypothetical protein